MKVEQTVSPNLQDIDFLTAQINQESPTFGSAYAFGFFVRDADDKIIAGCNGCVVFGAIYTDQLWVHPDYRKQGWGRKLMESVHAYGKSQGCSMSTLNTMSFQAEAFYERLSYTCDFIRPGYANGARCLFMKKALD